MSALTEFTKAHASLIEEVMERFVKEHTSDQRLFESMQYSIQAGGKRIRPLLLAATSPLFTNLSIPRCTSVRQP